MNDIQRPDEKPAATTNSAVGPIGTHSLTGEPVTVGIASPSVDEGETRSARAQRSSPPVARPMENSPVQHSQFMKMSVPLSPVWSQALREGVVAGSIASVLSTIVLALAGMREARSAVAPINAVSHWLWGDESLHVQEPTWRHTLTGYLTQHAASIFWATLYSRVYGHRAEAKRVPQAVAGAIATTGVAYLVDYKLVPKRLTPGYEHRVGGGSMLAIYGALAAGFALGAVLLQGSDSRR